MSYYSIYVPSKLDHGVNDEPFVFTEKDEAFKVLKNHKDARLKIFKNNEDAINYAQTGKEVITTKFNDLKSPVNVEKSAFHAPTKQELIRFRKAIEQDKYDVVIKTIWDNPRYLVNLADTPTNLKEGPRYNALHVCAIYKRAKIASIILETISNAHYVGYLHNQDDEKLNQETSNVLLDYYLNMPEKGRSETPLHLAVKYGSVDVVEVLTAYPQCKMTPNSENLLPRDIVCSRVDNASPELKKKILVLLEEKFYVPVIRSVDNSIPPMIGEPFPQGSPPQLNNDPRSPELKIQAYAGPIKTKEEAEKFRRRWKTPPRNGMSSPVANSPYISPMRISSSTPTRSLSNNKNNNNHSTSYSTKNINYMSAKKNLTFNFEDTENNINITISNNNNNNGSNSEISSSSSSGKIMHSTLTPLIKNPKKKDLFFTYRDRISSPIVFDDNDSYSSSGSNWEQSDKDDSPCLKERHLKLADAEKGFEIIGRELAKEQNIGWKEYWDFLDTFVNIASPEGLSQLESYLTKRFKEKMANEKMLVSTNIIDEKCDDSYEFWKQTVPSLKGSAIKTITDQDITTPYLCVEKSLQVFAKRMKNTILNNLDSVVSINDAFANELKRLESLVCSFRDDIRFLNIDFNVIHSRFANLITNFLLSNQETTIDSSSLRKLKKCFQQIVEAKKKIQMKQATDKKEQLLCVSEMILDYLECMENKNKVEPENINTEQICSQLWQEELKCNCNWKTDLSIQDVIRSRRLRRKQLTSYFQSLEIQDKDSEEVFKYLIDDKEEKYKDQNSTDSIKASGGEEELFWSESESSDSDDEKFYTPPSSPTQLEIEDYNIFLKTNDKPTKRDWDVVKALHGIEIDKEKYPKVHKWRTAILRYSTEECESFPSPTSFAKTPAINKQNTNNKLEKIKQCLFRSPLLKNHHQYINDNLNVSSKDSPPITSSLSLSFDENNYRNTLSSNLSLLNVSDI